MRQEFASSIDEYMSIVHEGNAGISRKAPDNYETLCFRGQPNSEYELLPAIARDCKDIGSYSLLYEERNLIETAKYELPEVFTADLWPIELLALLQHHGIPTRLLDITDNPLVALFLRAGLMKMKPPKTEKYLYSEEMRNTSPMHPYLMRLPTVTDMPQSRILL